MVYVYLVSIKNKQYVLKKLRRHHHRIAAYGVTCYFLFGSIARGEERDGSDVDLLVEFEPHMQTLSSIVQLRQLLEELLEQRVDLFTMDSFIPLLRPRILHHAEFVSLVEQAQ